MNDSAKSRSPSLIIVGTDTDAGKTTLAALLLHAGAWSYWKPIQSGPPDTDRIRELCPEATVHDACYTFAHPAAPDVAARLAGAQEPDLDTLLDSVPDSTPLLIESLGGPLSPIARDVLQVEFLAALDLPAVLVAKNRVGAIHACLASMESLTSRDIECRAIFLMGPGCEDNRTSIARHAGVPVYEVDWPTADTPAAFAEAARAVEPFLGELRNSAPEQVAGSTLRDIDASKLWHPYTPLIGEEDRPVCLRAEREFLHLDTGERLIDGISSWWTCIHGHAHPRLRAALRAASRDHDQVIFAGMTHEPGVRLAEELLGLLPDSFARVFYSDNGSTAVEVALKIVHGHWRRRGVADRHLFLCFEGAYHGDTFGTMSVGRDPVFAAEFEGLLFDVVQIPFTADATRDALVRHGERLAGVVLEPLIQAAGGMRCHAPTEVQRICTMARDAGLPVVFDEVMTGFGRTAKMFAFEHLDGFVPDVLCLAKGLSGGVLPLAATVVNHEVSAPWLDGDRAKMLFHGHSYTANPLACATGRAGLELFREGQPLRDAARIEASWRDEFAAASRPAGMHDLRICGTVVAFELGDGSGDYLSDVRSRVIATARECGVFLRPLGNTVYAMPPLCTSDASLAKIAAALRAVT